MKSNIEERKEDTETESTTEKAEEVKVNKQNLERGEDHYPSYKCLPLLEMLDKQFLKRTDKILLVDTCLLLLLSLKKELSKSLYAILVTDIFSLFIKP
eukprot:CAMPEP_0170524936 /NCGR_PEP_ID=MMETSP0209-20121228/10401_1 /TAXON_ID=665100 ORGANISM="Litonotus pictus, Strain P1" /NCGR_SAMPLE_ID=MMETSP0209 /ASSEMBLY_ACC=CAM_ASM_000301 /LENGTH=97 /DNA_ID=CAMNT_0010813923 /DNA_START=227 /DNA_END=516 /DNA_ORIENTATION=+